MCGASIDDQENLARFADQQPFEKLDEDIGVALRQVRQNFGVDFALSERRLILTETEAAQPTADYPTTEMDGCVYP
jgi:hypothetical protein